MKLQKRILAVMLLATAGVAPAGADGNNQTQLNPNPVLIPAVSTYPMDQKWLDNKFSWDPAALSSQGTQLLREALKQARIDLKNLPSGLQFKTQLDPNSSEELMSVLLPAKDFLTAASMRYGAPYFLEVNFSGLLIEDKSEKYIKKARKIPGIKLPGSVSEAAEIVTKYETTVTVIARLVNALDGQELGPWNYDAKAEFDDPPEILTSDDARKMVGDIFVRLAGDISKNLPSTPVNTPMLAGMDDPGRVPVEGLVDMVKRQSDGGIRYAYIDVGGSHGIRSGDRFEVYEVEYDTVEGRFLGKDRTLRGVVEVTSAGPASSKVTLESGEELEELWEVRQVLDEGAGLRASLHVEYGIDSSDIRERTIDAGSDDGVEVGMRFEVFEGGSERVGVVEVTEVDTDYCLVEPVEGRANLDGSRVILITAE